MQRLFRRGRVWYGWFYENGHRIQRTTRCRDKSAAETVVREAGPAGITVSAFREALGTSRKFALPLLEWFDHRGVTRRAGDLRFPAAVPEAGPNRRLGRRATSIAPCWTFRHSSDRSTSTSSISFSVAESSRE